LYDHSAVNWPDLREGIRRQPRGRRFATTWCHGAPGIALARLRAVELHGDRRCEQQALLALETTRRAVVDELAVGLSNYSLCHGMTGNASVLVEGARKLQDRQSDAALADEVAAAGVRSFAHEDQEWPCGASGGATPSLMLGLAGIGYFYLTLSDSSLPSVLTLCPSGWRASGGRHLESRLRHHPATNDRCSSRQGDG
jgi:lantibiotic biosynthesis protein